MWYQVYDNPSESSDTTLKGIKVAMSRGGADGGPINNIDFSEEAHTNQERTNHTQPFLLDNQTHSGSIIFEAQHLPSLFPPPSKIHVDKTWPTCIS